MMSEKKEKPIGLPHKAEFEALMDHVLSGGIYRPAPVSQQPKVTLTRWAIKEAKGKDGTTTLHAIGWCGDGRVSSAIGAIVAEEGALRFTTASGRQYELIGPSGTNMDAEYVWGRWKTINEIVEEKDVSNEYYTRQ